MIVMGGAARTAGAALGSPTPSSKLVGAPYRSSRATSSTTGATSRKMTRPIVKTRKEPANGRKAFQPISIS